MILDELIRCVGGTLVSGGENGYIIGEKQTEAERGGRENAAVQNAAVTGIADDSRYLKRGEAFFCLRGGKYNGENFAQEAVKRGACAVITQKILPLLPADDGNFTPQILVKDTRRAMSLAACAFYSQPATAVKTVGVTGTNGKTTVTYLLSSVFQKAGEKTGVIGTTGIVYADRKIDPSLTTPDPAYLQKTLANMRQKGVKYAFLEVSAHAIFYEKTAGMPFRARVFTNCTRDHLDFFDSMKNYADTKKSFFLSEDLSENAVNDEEAFVVNADDEIGAQIAREAVARGKRTLTYGLKNPADVFAVITDETSSGSKFLLNLSDELCKVDLPMAGRYNVYNALAAAATAFALHVPIKSIAEGLNSAIAPRGRLQRIATATGAEIFIDYAHTPDGLEKSLSALRPFCKGKLYCLFGCGGDRDKGKRPKMGEIAAQKADFTYLTSDNPRYEDAFDIIRQIEKGFCRFSEEYACVSDRKAAVYAAVRRLKKGDILLIAGKGGESMQESMGVKYEYDDEIVVAEALTSLGG